jgi:hypothetical protein
MNCERDLFAFASTETEMCLGVSKLGMMGGELSRHCIVGVVGFASRPFFLASFPLKQKSEEPRDVLGYLSRIFVRKTTSGTRLPRLFGASNQLRVGPVHTQTNLKLRALGNSGLGVA